MARDATQTPRTSRLSPFLPEDFAPWCNKIYIPPLCTVVYGRRVMALPGGGPPHTVESGHHLLSVENCAKPRR